MPSIERVFGAVPAMADNKVDLPHPLGPCITAISPSSICNENDVNKGLSCHRKDRFSSVSAMPAYQFSHKVILELRYKPIQG